MHTRTLERLFGVLVFWSVLTGIFAWLPLMRILGRPEGYTWEVLGLRGEGSDGPFWIFIIATVWVLAMLWTLVRGPRTASYAMVVPWQLLVAGIVVAGAVQGGTDATLQGQGLRWEISLWVLAFPFLLGAAVAVAWAAVDGRRGVTPVATGWERRNTLWLGASLALAVAALFLFRAGTNYNGVTAAAIVATIGHWTGLVVSFGRVPAFDLGRSPSADQASESVL